MKGPEFALTHIIEEGDGNSITNSVQSFMKQQPIKASTELIEPDRLRETLKSSIATQVKLSDLGNLTTLIRRRSK
ncbi:hypothetical protein ACW66K_07580, partial [Aerococcus urinaeequi]